MTTEGRAQPIETIHLREHDPAIFSPYVPAIRVHGGSLVFISGITAAPVYHDHPHRPEVFDAIPGDAESQAHLLLQNLDLALDAVGCRREHIVQLMRFFIDVGADQDVVNRIQAAWFDGHIPTSTTVEVSRLATDPRLRLEMQAVVAAPDSS